MKAILFTLLSTISVVASASPSTSMTCRAFDYYQLGGNRKILELNLVRNSSGNFDIDVARVFEILKPDRSYEEQERTVVTSEKNVPCSQGGVGYDPKVIACSKPGLNFYAGVTRIDHTTIMSPNSSKPGRGLRVEVRLTATMAVGFCSAISCLQTQLILEEELGPFRRSTRLSAA